MAKQKDYADLVLFLIVLMLNIAALLVPVYQIYFDTQPHTIDQWKGTVGHLVFYFWSSVIIASCSIMFILMHMKKHAAKWFTFTISIGLILLLAEFFYLSGESSWTAIIQLLLLFIIIFAIFYAFWFALEKLFPRWDNNLLKGVLALILVIGIWILAYFTLTYVLPLFTGS